MRLAFEVPYWIISWLPWVRREMEGMEARAALTGAAKRSRSKQWLGGVIEVGVEYELQDKAATPPTKGTTP